MSYSTSGPIETILRKEDTVDPVAGNDNTQGYAIKSRWINTSSNEEWVCTDASTGAALWELTTGGDGDVVGPASATNRGLVLWDGTTGKLVKDMPNISVGGLQAATLAISAGVGRAVAMLEQASGVTTASAGYGKFWVQNDAPNTPMFTDDAGTEKALTFTEGAISDTAVPRIRTDGHLEASSDLTLTGGQVRLSNISTASLRIRDSAAAPATITGYGYFWVRDDAPTTPVFTNDTGVDEALARFVGTSPTQTYVPIGYDSTGEGRLQTSLLKYNVGELYLGDAAGSLRMNERATGPTFADGDGFIWMKSDAPTSLHFTDDVGTDLPVARMPASINTDYVAVSSNSNNQGLLKATQVRINASGQVLINSGADVQLMMKERTTGPTGTATYGHIWVKDDIATTLMFTDDADVDHKLNNPLSITLASNELVDVDATEVVIGGAYIDGSTGGTFTWEILGTYNDNGGTGVQDLDVYLYDRGPDGTPVAGVLRSTLSIDTLDTLDRVSQTLTASGTPGVDTDTIFNTGRLYEVRAKLDAGGGVDTAKILSVRFIES